MTTILRRLGVVTASIAVTLTVALVGVAVGVGTFLAPPTDSDGYVLLVLGSDEGPPRGGSAMTGRADGFHLIVVSADHQHATIMSFPRDTWTSVPGLGNTKINAALTRGPENAVAAAERETGLQVDDWIVTGFDGLIMLVGSLGGVQIDVEQRLTHMSRIEAGPQRLSGTTALSYLRDRKSRPGGDLDRAEAHGRFLAAVHQQIVTEGPGLDRLFEHVASLDSYTESSLSTTELLRLAAMALRIPPQNVQRVRLDGRIGTAGSASVVYLTDAARDVIEEVRVNGMLGMLPEPAVPEPATSEPAAPEPAAP
ncbi:MAG TPA: LCP family protein [Nitriliruptorales bacterium]